MLCLQLPVPVRKVYNCNEEAHDSTLQTSNSRSEDKSFDIKSLFVGECPQAGLKEHQLEELPRQHHAPARGSLLQGNVSTVSALEKVAALIFGLCLRNFDYEEVLRGFCGAYKD